MYDTYSVIREGRVVDFITEVQGCGERFEGGEGEESDLGRMFSREHALSRNARTSCVPATATMVSSGETTVTRYKWYE